MRPTLVIIDMQKQFLDGAVTEPPLADAVEITNHVAGLMRTAKRPVIWVHDLESCAPSDVGFDVIDALEQEPQDVHIHKLHGNAFRETELADVLAVHKTEIVFVAGFKAEGCVLATLKGLEDRDMAHAIIRQTVVSGSADGASFVERISPIISYEVVEVLLKQQ